jgi:zinc transport system ATP-binding protein
MANVLEVKDLSVNFGGEVVVKDLDLSLEKGESLAIIGPNGAGKTVFLHALLGMIKHAGAVTWAAGARIGYVPQKIDADRHLPINAGDLLHAKAATAGLAKKDIDEVISILKLDKKLLDTPVGHLSGGQFQKALIAYALLGEPNVLILDEPTASIDKAGEEMIYELLHRLQEKYDMTMIVVSHDLAFVYKYATKVFCMDKTGLCFGAPEEALTPKIMEKLYGSHRFFHQFHHDR